MKELKKKFPNIFKILFLISHLIIVLYANAGTNTVVPFSIIYSAGSISGSSSGEVINGDFEYIQAEYPFFDLTLVPFSSPYVFAIFYTPKENPNNAAPAELGALIYSMKASCPSNSTSNTTGGEYGLTAVEIMPVCTCNSGTEPDATGHNCIALQVKPYQYITPPKNYPPELPKCPSTDQGNPIDASSGLKHQIEIDYAADDLIFKRDYISTRIASSNLNGAFGATGWRMNWQRYIDLNQQYGSYNEVNVVRDSGLTFTFNLTNGVYISDSDVNGKLYSILSQAGNKLLGWKYVNDSDETEVYTPLGQLVSLTTRAGKTSILTYSDGTAQGSSGGVIDGTNTPLPSGLLVKITNAFGRTIEVGYDAQSRIVKMIDPSGEIYSYVYSGNLASITFPDGSIREYLYENKTFQSSLTGIIDENGARFATWSYDSSGRAVSSEHAVGVEKVTLAFNSSSTVITDALGTARTQNYVTVQNVSKSAGMSQPGGAGCGAAASAFTYDANGNLASSTNFNGVKTTYSYDTVRNLELSRTEASGTPQARTTTTQWHPTYRLPVIEAKPQQLTTYVYDNSGNLLSKTLQATTDLTGAQGVTATTTGTPRTWTYTYNAMGQVLTVTGPRTDVASITTYTYDANGNLNTITDALGHVTTMSDYDANGRVGLVTDPNGSTTSLVYSPRGWLTTRTRTSGNIVESTTYAYDHVGQVTQVTMPDSSTINYVYDNAHRLTNISDSLGNSIAYTLDNMGNRLSEKITDTHGVLAHKITRIYDALNRLQQKTGGMQ